MLNELKVLILMAIRQVEQVLQDTAVRYLIKNHISSSELPIWKLLSWDFIRHLGLHGILSIAAIASFTLFTFPFGMWIMSFNAGIYFPLGQLFMTVIGMFLVPFNLWTLHKTVGEITFNQTTLIGIGIIEVSGLISILGWYFIYIGSKPQ